jgi:O-antigen/teichoic acid export membrane protein
MSLKNILTLRQRVLQSGSWTLAGYGVGQVLRLGGNLILTRLLFPEAFGLMAIFQAVSFGVIMLSDVGIGPSIIQSERGNEPAFLNTAWTIQILRGLLACVVLCALAVPIAEIYSEPLLAAMLPVAGLLAFISGFSSTKLYVAQSNMEAARITQMEIGTSAIGLLCTVMLAWVLKSVWALVWGSVITTGLKVIVSHMFIHGVKNQFAWDRDAVSHLRGFGRWVLLGSALTFLSSEGARLLFGALLDMRQLAMFTLASAMSLMFWQAMQQVSGRVYFPAYSEVYRSNPKKLASVLFKARLTIIFPNWSLAVLFIFLGSQLMDKLYDERYHGSGLMLELLAVGLLARCLWGSYSGALLAMGQAATETMLTAMQIVCQISGISIGYYYWGGVGIVIGMAAANWVMYPVNAYVMARNGLWQPKLDIVMGFGNQNSILHSLLPQP